MELFKDFSLAELSQPQINDTLNLFKEFFTGKNIFVSNDQQHGNIQRLFRLQNCLSRRSVIPRKFSKTFSPVESSQPQIIDTPKIFEDFFTCRIDLAANHQQPGIIQRIFRLQKCLSRRSSIPRKFPLTFSPAELSQPQIINNMETFKDFFACRIVLAADHRYPEKIQRFFNGR